MASSPPTLTAGQVARYIQRPDEPLGAAIARFRNWEKTGIIKAAGDSNPGTGRKKRFSSHALAEAILLQALTDTLGSPAVSVRPLVDKISKMGAYSIPMAATHVRGKQEPGFRGPELIVLSKLPDSDELAVTPIELDDLQAYVSNTAPDIHVIINVKNLFERVAHNWSDAVVETVREANPVFKKAIKKRGATVEIGGDPSDPLLIIRSGPQPKPRRSPNTAKILRGAIARLKKPTRTKKGEPA
jgi:hypothetical protein